MLHHFDVSFISSGTMGVDVEAVDFPIVMSSVFLKLMCSPSFPAGDLIASGVSAILVADSSNKAVPPQLDNRPNYSWDVPTIVGTVMQGTSALQDTRVVFLLLCAGPISWLCLP